MPISPEALAELEKTDPELVARYRAKTQAGDDQVNTARNVQAVGSIANTLGSTLNDYANSRQKDVVLANRMQDLGKAPTVVDAKRSAYDPSVIEKPINTMVQNAENDRTRDEGQFLAEQRLAGISRDRARQDKVWGREDADYERTAAARAREDDVSSEESKAAQALATKMKPDRDWSTMSATQIKALSPTLEKLYGIEQQRLSRKDLLNAKAAAGAAKPAPLGEDDKAFVRTLSGKNASKEAIANQIHANLAQWDAAKDDKSRLAIGRQMLKILNSTEGADAIGKDEANRLGAKLEFAMGNLTNDNPVQFGRDLPGFRTDAEATEKAIRGSISANQDTIDSRMGRKKPVTGPGGIHGEDLP